MLQKHGMKQNLQAINLLSLLKWFNKQCRQTDRQT